MRTLFCLLALALPGWAACTGSSPNLSAPETGNVQTNGQNLQACLNAAVDGDTITLTAGSTYQSPSGSESPISFPARMGASSYVTIKTSATIPQRRILPTDSSLLATIETPTNYPPIEFAAGSSYYRLDGLIVQTAPTSYAAGKFVALPLIQLQQYATPVPHHIEVLHSICRPYEAVVFHYNRTAQECFQIEGPNWSWQDGYVYGFGGVTNNYTFAPQKNISAVTQGTTPTATSTGHGLGIGTTSGAAFEGFTGNWTRLNGMSYFTTVDANTFTIYKKFGLAEVVSNVAKVAILYGGDHNLQVGDTVTFSGFTDTGFNGTHTVTGTGAWNTGYKWFSVAVSGVSNGWYCNGNWKTCGRDNSYANMAVDTTGFGALTGTPYGRMQAGDWSLNSYGFLQIAGNGPAYIYDTFCQAQFSCLFTGGGGANSDNTTTLTAASAGQATLMDLGNLQVGDLVAVKYTGHPTMGESCSRRSESEGCLYWAAAKVLTINPSTKVVTWKGYGNQPLESSRSGMLTISGTTATWTSGHVWMGTDQSDYVTGSTIHIGSGDYVIYSHDSTTQLTLETAPANGSYSWTYNMVADVPGQVMWNGDIPSQIYMRKVTLDKDISISFGSICKAGSEIKTGDTLVFEGIHQTGTPCITIGEPTYNQTGSMVWTRHKDNIRRGYLVDNAERGIVFNADDPYRSGIANFDGSEKTGSRNNLFTDFLFLNASAWDYSSTGGFDDASSIEHWGIVRSAESTSTNDSTGRFMSHNGCNSFNGDPIYGYMKGKIRNNIMLYGTGWGDFGNCVPSQSTQATYNLFIDNRSQGSGTILAAFPTGTKVVTAEANVGWHTGCNGYVANWLNCYLDDSSPGRAAASDGRDIGPDIDLINDLINDYSCVAGLCAKLTGVRNDSAFSIANTTTSITFTVQGTVVNCTLRLYTDPARVTLAADTNTSGRQACNRTGNTVVGKQVTFALGSQTALSPSTPYYYKISVTDSGEVMVGSFTTTSGPVAPTITTACPMPDGTQNVAYSQTLTATGSTPITWSIPTGSLPMDISRTGAVISGTPSGTGTSNFTIQAENSVGLSTNGPIQCAITINPPSSGPQTSRPVISGGALFSGATQR